jgi:hypothetical protein
VEDPRGQYSVLAVLDELTELRQASLLGFTVLLDDADKGGMLVVKAIYVESIVTETHKTIITVVSCYYDVCY